MILRKGQFIFNFLRDYFSHGDIDNPYPNCHFVIFNISDEYWDKIEEEYKKFKSDPSKYSFPSKPFGDSIMSPEHAKALSESLQDLAKSDFKIE